MKLRDKRFWKFEAMMLLSSPFTFMLFVLSVSLFSGRYETDVTLNMFAATFILLHQSIGGIITWRLCRWSESWKGFFINQMFWGIITLIALFLFASIMLLFLLSDPLYLFYIVISIFHSPLVVTSSILPTMLFCYLYKCMSKKHKQ